MRILNRNLTAVGTTFALAVACHQGLEVNHDEYPEWVEFRDKQESILSSYEAVGEGVYQIPVDRAIELVAADPDLLAPVVEPEPVKSLEEMTLVERGEYHFNNTYVCASCHAFDGSRKVGPHLNNRWGGEAPLENGEVVAFDDAYFRESVWNSMAKIARGYPPAMPVFQEQMTEEDYKAIKAYVLTYQEGKGGPEGVSGTEEEDGADEGTATGDRDAKEASAEGDDADADAGSEAEDGEEAVAPAEADSGSEAADTAEPGSSAKSAAAEAASADTDTDSETETETGTDASSDSNGSGS